MGWIRSFWNSRPLALTLWIALLLRLVAALLSKGYGMHDDHFLVIETAQSWLDGAAYNNWFLERESASTPTILNFFYAGLHYIFFFLLEKTGLTDAQAKMYFIRIIHALWSLLIVYYGYKITEKLDGRKSARLVALLLAAFWFMPFFSVRNLVETVCIPFLMGGYWLMVKAPGEKGHLQRVFYASLLFGLAFSFRFQTLIFPAGIGLILLYRKKLKEALLLAGGTALVILLTHGLADWVIWGKPFTALGEYINHNVHHRFEYTSSPWYTYVLVIVGVLLPPISLFLLAGYFKTWKKLALFFFPTLLFLIFHSLYPNKQERFIIPALPIMITLGVIGWNDIKQRWLISRKQHKAITASWVFFWAINLVMLFFFTTMYSKKARVESMTYLSGYDNIGVLLCEDVHRPYASMLPLYYLQQWPEVYTVTEKEPLEAYARFLKDNPSKSPSFILFFDSRDLETRVKTMQRILPGIIKERVIEPGLPDRVLHRLNPVNANQTIYIYRNTGVVADKTERQDP